MFRALALVPLLLAAAALFDAADARALSCQRRIVTRGDSVAKVVHLCGEPASRVDRNVMRSQTIAQRDVAGAVVYSTISVSVNVSTWVYDFGPLRLMQELTFEDGTLVNLRTLGHGHRARLEEADRHGSRYAVRYIIGRRRDS